LTIVESRMTMKYPMQMATKASSFMVRDWSNGFVFGFTSNQGYRYVSCHQPQSN
jgi:hypothetical protein